MPVYVTSSQVLSEYVIMLSSQIWVEVVASFKKNELMRSYLSCMLE
jgi:hypothetical protein